ncbi:MAG: CBS domain-containing protein [Chloroflexota bacterium]
MKLSDLLSTKDLKYRTPILIGPNETVSAAIQKLSEHDRGALPVCDDAGKLVGIITERDIMRKCLARDQTPAKTKIRDIMTKDVIIGIPDDDLDYAINAMKQKRIRHIPIVDKQKVVGMISMRDLLGVQVEECRLQVRLLSDYISGGQA